MWNNWWEGTSSLIYYCSLVQNHELKTWWTTHQAVLLPLLAYFVFRVSHLELKFDQNSAMLSGISGTSYVLQIALLSLGLNTPDSRVVKNSVHDVLHSFGSLFKTWGWNNYFGGFSTLKLKAYRLLRWVANTAFGEAKMISGVYLCGVLFFVVLYIQWVLPVVTYFCNLSLQHMLLKTSWKVEHTA